MTTNYERIAGTPEKLAEFIKKTVACHNCPIFDRCDGSSEFESRLREWLQEECDE